MFLTDFDLTLNWFCCNKSEILSDLILNLRNEWMYFVICMHCSNILPASLGGQKKFNWDNQQKRETTFPDSKGTKGVGTQFFSKNLVWKVTLKDAVPRENPENFRKNDFLCSTQGKNTNFKFTTRHCRMLELI